MKVSSLKARAKRLKSEIQAVYLAARDPKTPWYAKVLAVFIVGYALSPIDLIPDFIPVIGYLDDLIIVPAGIALLLRMIPTGVLQESRIRAQANPISIRKNWIAGTIIILIWLLLVYITLSFLWGILEG
jgi:uncharacterized membrane protein YkvA (DUF1232 family)